MNEQELRDGLREVMAVSSQPPAMDPAEALDAAKRAHRRRRATWAGAGASAAVVALAAGTVFALTPGGEPLQIGVAAGGSPPTTALSGTETSWPNGQRDRTATNGPRFSVATDILATLKAALPGTLTVDDTLTFPDSGGKVTSAQADFRNYYGPDNKQEAWAYTTTVAVTGKAAPKAGTGRVLVAVHTPGNPGDAATDLCALTSRFWSVGGSCATRIVQGKAVGVVATTKDDRIDSVAAHRYEDGTVVFAAQSKKPFNVEDGPAMATLPLTVDQLATLAVNPAFKVK